MLKSLHFCGLSVKSHPKKSGFSFSCSKVWGFLIHLSNCWLVTKYTSFLFKILSIKLIKACALWGNCTRLFPIIQAACQNNGNGVLYCEILLNSLAKVTWIDPWVSSPLDGKHLSPIAKWPVSHWKKISLLLYINERFDLTKVFEILFKSYEHQNVRQILNSITILKVDMY